MSEDDILDAKQVAGLLHVGYRTVLRMAERGELPCFRVGDLWRFRKSDIEQHIDEQVRKSQEKED